ncbi:unnamed protein product [Enterobius vermicularis]|uniref:Major sperm protein n=1 Tax=Enterobius vermicularis TaxID=51028 RepID=A0A0N4V5G1_ENTVE|nr:unnamed protein product [Enterobius vermicularis]
MDELARCRPASINSRSPTDESPKSNHDSVGKFKIISFVNDKSSNDVGGSTSRKIVVSSPVSLQSLIDSRKNASSSETFTTSFLKICPRDEITLNTVQGENDLIDIIALKNEGNKSVMYEILVSSSEKFRARPNTGTIAAGATDLIHIHLLSEYKHTIDQDNIAIVAVEVGTPTNSNFETVFKKADEKATVAYRLGCHLAGNVKNPSTHQTSDSSDKLEFTINQLALCSQKQPYNKSAADEMRPNLDGFIKQKPLADSRKNASSSETITNKFLKICPRDEITLNTIRGESDPVDIIALKNESTKYVFYKIKITSPEKFRVRPSTGIVAAGDTDLVRVYVQKEYKNSVNQDRFLIMAVEAETRESSNFASLWKNADEGSKVEHKLRCRFAGSTENNSALQSAPDVDDSLRQQIAQISKSQWYLTIIIVILVGLHLVSLFFTWKIYYSVSSSQELLHLKDTETRNIEPIDVDSEL